MSQFRTLHCAVKASHARKSVPAAAAVKVDGGCLCRRLSDDAEMKQAVRSEQQRLPIRYVTLRTRKRQRRSFPCRKEKSAPTAG